MTDLSPHELAATLAAAFHRRSCPPPDELGEYQLALLSRRRTARVTRHLREGCPHCRHELAQLRVFLGDLAPEPEPAPAEAAVERVRVAVGRLVSGARELLQPPQPAWAPAYAGVRGGVEEPAVYKAEEVQIIAGAQPDAAAPDRGGLNGLVVGVDPAGFTAYLWQDGELIAAAPIDEVGNFVVPDLARGGYELLLAGPDLEIYIKELKF
jgi:hypothetical protein